MEKYAISLGLKSPTNSASKLVCKSHARNLWHCWFL